VSKALTDEQREELSALASINKALGRKSFIARRHWHESGYASLVRRGFVRWTSPPKGFDKKRFAGTHITPAGRAALQKETPK
jgi:hypothetical protein